MRLTVGCLLLFALFAPAARAQPTLQFAPAPQIFASFPPDTAVDGIVDLTLSGNGSQLAASIVVAYQGTTVIDNATVTSCRLTNDAIAISPLTVSFDGLASQSARFDLTCTRGTEDIRAILRCASSRKGSSQVIEYEAWDVSCPSLAPAAFASTPAAGSSIAPPPVVVGGTSTANLRVQSAGNSGSVLRVAPAGLVAPIAISPTAEQAIASGQFVDFSIVCAPTTVGVVQQTLDLATNAANAGPQGRASYVVSCTGLAPPRAEFDSSPTAPGTLAPIDTAVPASAGRVLQLRNLGTAPLGWTLSGLAPPFSASPTTGSIAAGGSQDVTITCDGSAAGSFADAFVVTTPDDADEGSNAFDVACLVRQAQFASSPAPGPAALATTQGVNASRTIVVTNAGNAALVLNGASGLVAPLSVTGLPTTIGQGANGTFAIACNATNVGTFGPQSLTLATNVGNFQFQASCTVTAGSAPEFSSVPAPTTTITLDTLAGATAQSSLVVTNVGNAGLAVTVQAAPASPVTLAPASGTVNLAQNASQSYAVSCSSPTAGTFARTFTLASNDADEGSVTFNVSCQVAAAAPEFSATPPAPGPISLVTPVGTPASNTIAIANLGSAALNVSAFTGIAAPFSVTPANDSVPAGQSRNFSIGCSGATPGFYTASIFVQTNDSDEGSVRYDLSCRLTANAPEINVLPAPGATVALSSQVGASTTSIINVSNQTAVAPSLLYVATSGLSGVLGAAPPAFTVQANGAQTVTVTCAPTAAATVSQTLVLSSNDSDEASLSWPVTCTGVVQPFVEIDTAPAFDATSVVTLNTYIGVPGFTSIRIFNRGFGQVLNANISRFIQPGGSGSGTVTVSPASLAVPAGEFRDFVFSCSSPVLDKINVGVTVSSNDPDESSGFIFYECSVSRPVVLTPRTRAALLQVAPPRRAVLLKDGFEDR